MLYADFHFSASFPPSQQISVRGRNALALRMALAGIFALFASGIARAEEEPLSVELREFEVLVDDKPIGVHQLRIHEQGDRTHVNLRSDICVKVLFYRYVYEYEAKEVWEGPRLIAFDASTNDNGKKSQLKLKFNMTATDFPQQAAKMDVTHQSTSYSRLPPGVKDLKTVRLLDVEDGETVSTTWIFAEYVDVPLKEGALRCQKWRVDGDVQAELWFDDAGWLVGRKTVERGHRSEFRLTSIERERATK